jgi:hypothetical protein
VLFVSSMLTPQTASALSCDGWYGHACWRGYFKDQLRTSGQDVINGGMDVGTGDKAGFINTVIGHLNSGDPHRATAAQFIILSMSGAGFMPPKGVNGAQLADWEARVNNPAVSLVREDALFACNIANSFYQDAGVDDIAAGYSTPSEGCGAINPMIDFYVNGVLVYRIRIACANPLGNPGVLPGLPSPPPPIAVSCGNLTSVTPPKPEIGDTVTVTVTVSYVNGPPASGQSGGQIFVTGIGLVPISSITGGGGANGTYTMTSSFPVNTPGTYAVGWTLRVDGIAPTPNPNCGGNLAAAGDTFVVSTYPFFSVSGGDMAAGAAFATSPGSSCTEAFNTNAGITSWNKGASSGYSGASNQFGMSSFSYIQDILGNKGNGNGKSAWSLSFANEESGGINSVDQANGRYGGFNNDGPCVGAWSRKPASGNSLPNPGATNVGGLDGVYVVNSPVTINGGNIPNGKHITIYVTGNVSITGPITYASTSWATTDEIPSFKLVVNGSIFIGNTVSQLAGDYVAVPNAGYHTMPNPFNNVKPGTIVTCSVGTTPQTPATASISAIVNGCNHQLTVYGSFSANQVWLLRTWGTMGSNVPAEQFIQGPESWLSTGDSGSIDPSYKSIVGLPPVL